MRITRHEGATSSLPWLADEVSRRVVLPGGAQLAAGVNTKLEAGTALGETATNEWEPFVDATHDKVRLLLHSVDPAKGREIELVRPTALIRKNYLPGWDTLAAATQTAIEAQYETTIGSEFGKDA